jgi:hypothetical protein
MRIQFRVLRQQNDLHEDRRSIVRRIVSVCT